MTGFEMSDFETLGFIGRRKSSVVLRLCRMCSFWVACTSKILSTRGGEFECSPRDEWNSLRARSMPILIVFGCPLMVEVASVESSLSSSGITWSRSMLSLVAPGFSELTVSI